MFLSHIYDERCSVIFNLLPTNSLKKMQAAIQNITKLFIDQQYATSAIQKVSLLIDDSDRSIQQIMPQLKVQSNLDNAV